MIIEQNGRCNQCYIGRINLKEAKTSITHDGFGENKIGHLTIVLVCEECFNHVRVDLSAHIDNDAEWLNACKLIACGVK